MYKNLNTCYIIIKTCELGNLHYLALLFVGT